MKEEEAPAPRNESLPQSPYDPGAEAYDAAGEDDPVWRERYRRLFLAELPGKRVLDAGCGPGYDTEAFAAAGLDVVAIDGSPRMVHIAGRRCPGAIVIRGDFRHLSAIGRPFDGIWAMFSLLHVPPDQLAECLEGWRECLVEGAPLFSGLAASSRMSERTVDDWLGMPDNPCTFYYHDLETIEAALDAGGFGLRAQWVDTPERYRTDHYRQLGLEAYVVWASARP